MAHPTLDYIKGLRAQLATKKAEIVGQDPNTIPGSENDKQIPAGSKAPDKETRDQTMVPNSGLTTAGAGDDSPITHKSDLTAEQAALTPKKEPQTTAAANADVPGGKTAEEKTAEELGAEILAGVDGWLKAKKEAEAKEAAEKGAADTQGPSSGAGTGEALITDNGKEPEQTKDVIPPTKLPESTPNAMAPATGEPANGETAAAAKEAAGEKDSECCKDGKCGKCAKCKAAASEAKKAGALDMELTQDVLAKIAAVMLATEEGTQLAEATLAKAAGAEAAEKTLAFLRAQNDLATKQAEYEAGQRAALATIQKLAQETPADADGAGSDDVSVIADTLDQMVEAKEITEDEADQIVLELAKSIAGDADPSVEDGSDAATKEKPEGCQNADCAAAPCEKKAQAVPAVVEPAAAGNAAIDQTVAVPPEQLDAGNLPQGGIDDIKPEDVAEAIDQLVQSGEITEDEADELVKEIVADEGEGDGSVSPEEIATALQEAVESGDLKPEDVQAVLTELEGVPASGADQEAAQAAVPAVTPEAAPAASAAAMTPADEPKTAGVKLMAAINAARASKAQGTAK